MGLLQHPGKNFASQKITPHLITVNFGFAVWDKLESVPVQTWWFLLGQIIRTCFLFTLTLKTHSGRVSPSLSCRITLIKRSSGSYAVYPITDRGQKQNRLKHIILINKTLRFFYVIWTIGSKSKTRLKKREKMIPLQRKPVNKDGD